jgi:penicillin-binding protein 2
VATTSGRPRGERRRQPAPGHAPRPIERSPGLDEEARSLGPGRPGASPLKRLEEEEKEQARRSETIRVGLRLTVMGMVVLALFSVTVLRLWSLQVLHHSSAVDSVIALTTRPVTITPPRGLIEARGGQLLVSNKIEPVVTLSRQVAAEDPAVVQRLAVALGMPVSQIYAAINDQQDSIYQPVPVEVGVPASAIVYLGEHQSLFPGVTVSDVAERQYPYGDTAAQTLGYVGDITAAELKQLKAKGYNASDVVGQSGIEYEYEQYLRGRPGTKDLLVDSAGYPVGVKQVIPAKPGDDVVLNIDLGLQQAAQTYLAQEIATLDSQGSSHPTNGAVVALDPNNGAVLAMASYPSYNPSWWVGGMSTAHYAELTSPSSGYPLLNRAIQGLYTPGSTFKLATATAALVDGLITPSTLVNDPGYFTVPNCTGGSGCVFHNNAGESCGACNIVTAISMSDDVFFYTLGYWFYSQPGRFGPDPIQKVAASYGLGQPSGIDLPDSYYGQLDSPALRLLQHREDPTAFPNTYYGPGDAINTAFGQGETLITPLELANAYATFANGGTRYAPEVAAEIISPTGKLVKRIMPRVMGRVDLPSFVRQTMLQGFIGAVTASNGTATYTLQALHYPYSKLPIAGKTGTSQVSNSNSVAADSLFVAFGPTSDPKYVIAAVIPHAGYGSAGAAPVVVKLFEYLITHPVGPVTPSVPKGVG